MIYIGIDPGKNGGLAILSGENVQTFRYDRDTYRCVLSDMRGEKAVCCLEHVSAMPGQGVTSMFHFGEGFGWLQGILEAYEIPYELVRPQKWKKEFSVTADKNTSIDWFIKPSNFQKVLEGRYNDAPQKTSAPSGRRDDTERLERILANLQNEKE